MKLNRSDLIIVAKQNNRELYLIAYKHRTGEGFVVDLEKGIRSSDDKVHRIRKKGLWIDIRCSENVSKRILEKVLKLNSFEK